MREARERVAKERAAEERDNLLLKEQMAQEQREEQERKVGRMHLQVQPVAACSPSHCNMTAFSLLQIAQIPRLYFILHTWGLGPARNRLRGGLLLLRFNRSPAHHRMPTVASRVMPRVLCQWHVPGTDRSKPQRRMQPCWTRWRATMEQRRKQQAEEPGAASAGGAQVSSSLTHH